MTTWGSLPNLVRLPSVPVDPGSLNLSAAKIQLHAAGGRLIEVDKGGCWLFASDLWDHHCGPLSSNPF